MTTITVIGRGHSGTRAVSHTLYASGVYMGKTLNPSGDLVPPHDLYDACRIFARYVTWQGGLNWDFSQALKAEIPQEFTVHLEQYLESVLTSKAEHKGWKIPETTLLYPWLTRLYPDIKYIILDSQPARLHLSRSQNRRPARFRDSVSSHGRRALKACHLLEVPVRPHPSDTEA